MFDQRKMNTNQFQIASEQKMLSSVKHLKKVSIEF